MFHPRKQNEKAGQESKGDYDVRFCWGPRKGVVTLYKSFILDDTEYALYDCVYVRRGGQEKADVGKLVNILESESREKKVEVVWFFRPAEIANWLGDDKPLQRELFLACGKGEGVSGFLPLEAISGKCNVVCSSKHHRNPQPTEEELSMAEYIFYRTFDVGKYIISDNLPSSIHGIEVGHIFNKKRDTKPKAHSKVRSEEMLLKTMGNDQSARLEKAAHRFSAPIIPTSRQINNATKVGPSDVGSLKKRKLPFPLAEGPRGATGPYPPPRDFGRERLSAMDSCMEKKHVVTRKSVDEKANKFAEKGVGSRQHIGPAINYNYMEVTRKPRADTSKWFKPEVWDEGRLREMNDEGILVLLQNLDPTFTSAEVEDIIWCVFEEKVTAKMVQCTTLSSPHYGQAFAIFKTKEAADYVISRLTNGSLLLGDGRPIVGRRRSLPEGGTSVGFSGHLNVDRTRSWRQRQEMRNAVATSHFSQSNTIEYELAMQWRVLQEKSDLWWAALHAEQGKEIEDLMKHRKI